MKLRSMGIFELLALRNWVEMVYNSGRAYIPISKSDLEKLLTKLSEIDTEVMERVVNDEYLGAFFDENFDDTLKKVRDGEFDGDK